MKPCSLGVVGDLYLGVRKFAQLLHCFHIGSAHVGRGDNTKLTATSRELLQFVDDKHQTAPLDEGHKHIYPVGGDYLLFQLGHHLRFMTCTCEQGARCKRGFGTCHGDAALHSVRIILHIGNCKKLFRTLVNTQPVELVVTCKLRYCRNYFVGNSKIELQPSRPPTGMCLVTAEYVPEISQSGLARYFIVEMKSDDIDLALMTEYQQLAADGVLAAIMHNYVDWLRETYLCDENSFVQGLSDTFKKYRTEVTAELSARCENFHTRVPDTLAHLMIGFDFLLAFLSAKEEIGVQDMENYKSSFRNIIVTSSVRNNSIVENENYSYQFCDKLKSLLDSGRCSVNVIGSDCDMNRKGFIGFDDDNFYYLIMNAAFSEVVKLSKEMGESFSIGKNSLIQQLVDDGIMVVKGKRNTTTVRVTDDRQMSFAVLDKSKMFADTEVPKIGE